MKRVTVIFQNLSYNIHKKAIMNKKADETSVELIDRAIKKLYGKNAFWLSSLFNANDSDMD